MSETNVDAASKTSSEPIEGAQGHGEALAQIEKINATLNEAEELKAKLDALVVSQSEIEAQQGKLKTALEKTNDLISNIETIKTVGTEIESVKSEVDSNATTVKAALATATALRREIEQLKEASEKRNQELTVEYQTLKETLLVLTDKRKELEPLLEELSKIKASAVSDKEAVQVDIQTIAQAKTQFEDLKNQTQTVYDSLISRQSEVTGKISEISGIYDRIKQQHADLFEGKKNEDGSLAEKAVNDQIASLFSDLKNKLEEAQRLNQKTADDLENLKAGTKTEFGDLKATLEVQFKGLLSEKKTEFANEFATIGEQFEKLKGSLELEIRSLLPDAGAAGLASAYFEAKSKYSPTKYVSKVGETTSRWDKTLHFVGAAAAPAFFYIMLLAPLIFLAYHMIELFDWLKDHPNDLKPSLVAFRTLISLPLVAISYFGWNSISLYRGMYEEYNHKQRVLQLYESFKGEVDKHGTSEDQQKLLAIMLATVAEKPKLAIHKGDKGLGEIFRNAVFPASGIVGAVQEAKDLIKTAKQ